MASVQAGVAEALRTRYDKLQQEYDEIQAENKRIQKELASLRDVSFILVEENRKLSEENKKLTEDMVALKREMAVERARLEEDVRDVKRERAVERARLEEDVRDVKETMSMLVQGYQMRDLAAGLVACIQRQVPKAANIPVTKLLTTERMKELNITDSFVTPGNLGWALQAIEETGGLVHPWAPKNRFPLTVTRAVAEKALQGLDDEDKQYALNIIAYLDKKRGFRSN